MKKKMPEKIYLQGDMDCGEVTWCEDKINDDDTEYIKMSAYKELEKRIAELEAYSDKLAAGLPMLPKDIENIRQANESMAKRIAELEAERSELEAEIENETWVNGFRERIAELELEVDSKVSAWEIMKNTADRQKQRIAELEAEADAEHAKLVQVADEYRAYMAANRWIPVGERLPEENTDKILSVFYKDGYDIFMDAENTRKIGENDCASPICGTLRDGKFFMLEDGDEIAGTVTHWRPLPQPPEVSE